MKTEPAAPARRPCWRCGLNGSGLRRFVFGLGFRRFFVWRGRLLGRLFLGAGLLLFLLLLLLLLSRRLFFYCRGRGLLLGLVFLFAFLEQLDPGCFAAV